MSSDRKIDLYRLLPGVHRLRDADQQHRLEALLEIINQEVDLVGDHIDQLYENLFVETCQPWAVPYLGRLVGIGRNGLTVPADETPDRRRRRQSIVSPRREVADATHHYRRKGTLSVLEELAGSVAGWPSRAVEFYEQVARLRRVSDYAEPLADGQPFGGTLDLRDLDAMRRIAGPFDTASHVTDLRALESHRLAGRYHIPHVGLYLWRLRSYRLSRTTPACLSAACCEDCDGLATYAFNPLGVATPLFTKPEREDSSTDIAGERHVPAPLTLESFRDPSDRQIPSHQHYGRDRSVEIWVRMRSGDPLTLLDRERILPRDLGQLVSACDCQGGDENDRKLACEVLKRRLQTGPNRAPTEVVDRPDQDPNGTPPTGGPHAGQPQSRPSYVAAVDCERGLLTFLEEPAAVEVTFHYGLSGNVGGGEYEREVIFEDRTHSIRFRADQPGTESGQLTACNQRPPMDGRWSPSDIGRIAPRRLVRFTFVGEATDSGVTLFDSTDPQHLSGRATADSVLHLAAGSQSPRHVKVDRFGNWRRANRPAAHRQYTGPDRR